MPTIHFRENSLGPAVVAEEPDGGALADICDDAGAPIPFSCRGASCATCRVIVDEGDDLFDPANDDERDVLEMFADVPRQRLACCARVRPGDGVIRLRVADEDSLLRRPAGPRARAPSLSASGSLSSYRAYPTTGTIRTRAASRR